MLKIYQQTIKNKVTFEGIGLHTGKESKINIIPGTEDQGIIFKRIDLEKDNIVVASYDNVSSAILCTTLKNKKGVKVSTVEHLLAALYVAEIDNVTIEINGKSNLHELQDLLKEHGETKVQIRVKRESKIYIFSLKNPRKFNFNTFKNIRNKEYVKKISF